MHAPPPAIYVSPHSGLSLHHRARYCPTHAGEGNIAKPRRGFAIHHRSPGKPRRGGTFIAGGGARNARGTPGIGAISNRTPKGWHNGCSDGVGIIVSPLRGLIVLRTISGGCAGFARSTPGYICATPSGFGPLLCQHRGLRMLRMLHPRLFMYRPIRGFRYTTARPQKPRRGGGIYRRGYRGGIAPTSFYFSSMMFLTVSISCGVMPMERR